jgi:proteasome lid subunit RPN8/RPN11
MRQLIIPQHIFDEMIAHCKKGYPYEACGILAGEGNMVSKIYGMTNIEKSPVSYLLDSKEQFSVMKDMRENSLSMVAIFHSHPSSLAYPSRTDVNLAFYEDAVYVIVSLIEGTPVVKGFSIKEGKIEEVGVVVD